MDPITDSIQDSAARGGYAAIAAIVIWGLIAVIKRDDVPIPLPPRYRPLLALALGQVYAVLEAVVGGMPWGAAVVRGLVVAAGAIATHEVSSKLREAPAVKPPSVPPPMPPLTVLVLCLSLGPLAACSPSQLQVAASVANVAAETGSAAAPVLEARCVAPMRAAADAGDKAAARKVAEVCDSAVTAYEALRVAHVALRGAIVVAASGGDGAKIGALLADVGAAAAQLTEAVMAIHGGAK